MNSSKEITIKDIIALREENAMLEERIDLLRRENFEYLLKNHHMQNILKNVRAVIHDNPTRLCEVTAHLHGILQECQFNSEGSSATVKPPSPEATVAGVDSNETANESLESLTDAEPSKENTFKIQVDGVDNSSLASRTIDSEESNTMKAVQENICSTSESTDDFCTIVDAHENTLQTVSSLNNGTVSRFSETIDSTTE